MLAGGVHPDAGPGRSLLLLAAARGHGDIAEALIRSGADPGAVEADGWTAATIADAAGDDGLAERLIGLGVPAESRLAHGYTDLHRSARAGDTDACASIGPEGVDALDRAGDTPLALAIRFRHEECARSLLRSGADPNHSSDDWSLLTEAAYVDTVSDPPTSFVSMLVASGADLRPAGHPPVLASINQEGSSGAVLRALVDAGADPFAVDGDGETVLHRIASIVDDPELIDLALSLGLDLEARDRFGRTPLLSAAWCANETTFRRLVERGADTEARDGAGRSVAALVADNPGATGMGVAVAGSTEETGSS